MSEASTSAAMPRRSAGYVIQHVGGGEMTINIEQLRAGIRSDARKSFVWVVIDAGVAVTAGYGLGAYLASRQPVLQPLVPPGTVTTIPPAGAPG